MSTIERLYPPISDRPRPGTSAVVRDTKDDTIVWRRRVVGASLVWPMRLLPAPRREAIYALYVFCRELDDIADGEASRSLKQTLLLNWRSEIAHLYEGRPLNIVTRGLSEAIHRYGLRCDDFLAIIDGVEMDARTDIRAPSFEQLDRYRSAGSRCASSAKKRRQASVLPQNSVVHFSSPRYFAILPRMRGDTSSI